LQELGLRALADDASLADPHDVVGDSKALAHAERVVADAPIGLRRSEADHREELGDATGRYPHHPLGDGQGLAAGATGVLGRRIEHHADLAPRVRQVDESALVGGGRPQRW
jgi:hypothetical protein